MRPKISMNLKLTFSRLSTVLAIVCSNSLLETSNAAAHAPAGYIVETLEIPEGVTLGVGGLAFAPDDALFVTSREGQVWRLKTINGVFLQMDCMKCLVSTLTLSQLRSGLCSALS